MIFFSAIIETVGELLISNMHNKFEQNTKLFKLSRPQGQIIDVKNNNKSAILILSANVELVRELVICNMHNKFGNYRAHKQNVNAAANAAELQLQ